MDSMKTVPRDCLVVPVPKHLRHSPEHPPKFTLFLNVILAVATTVLVANIYYCQPLLIQLSQSFGVSYDDVSNAATLLQSGYAAGIMFITPLGDIVRRRALVLNLSVLSMALTFGVAFTRSFVAFQILSFFIGVVTCVPQVLMPLTADLAPPERRAFALSVTLSGLKFGMVYARVVAGLIANFVSWRIVYYLAIGIQALLIVTLYFLLPDFPVRNTGVSYARILLSMGRFAVTEPLLIQASVICFATMACFTNFWVTLTFLLGGPPYDYSTVVIGLFGLVGLFGVVAAPFVGKLVDGLVPWYATLVATVALIVFQAIQTGAGGVHIAAVVIVACGLDVFRQMQQVSLTTAVFGIDAAARSRLNAVVLISVFLGQIMGTAAGTEVFVRYGWRAAAALSLGWHGLTLLVLLLRGPHCARYTWFGYEGGLETRKKPVVKAPAKEEISSEDADSKEKTDDVDAGKSV